MKTLEFDSVVEDGRIELPASLKGRVSGPVHVRLGLNSEKSAEARAKLEKMMESPIYIPDFVPLSRDEANE